MARTRTPSRSKPQPTKAVHLVEVLEVVAAVVGLVEEGRTAQVLDGSIVHVAAQHDLGMAVDEGGPRPPEAVPEEEVVLGRRVAAVGQLCPAAPGIDVVVEHLAVKAQRVALLEDDEGVPAVELGDVAGGDAVAPLHPPEGVLRRALEGRGQRVMVAAGQLGLQVQAGGRPVGPVRTEPVEEDPLEGDQVGHLDDLLDQGRLYPPEVLLDPGQHGVRGHQPPVGHSHVEDALEQGSLGLGQLGYQFVQVNDFDFGCHCHLTIPPCHRPALPALPASQPACPPRSGPSA